MKLSKLATIIVTMAVALLTTACTLLSTDPPRPNTATFDIGATVGSNTSYQFISIISDESWSIEVEYLTPEGVGDWCSLDTTSGEGCESVYMSFGKNTLSEERSLNLHILFPKESITLHFTQLGNGEQPTQEPPKWLELPAFEADGERTYFSKHMLASSGNHRSFSLLYDSDIYHSHWVAYPISSLHTPGAGSRGDDWGRYDQNIPVDKQINLKYSFEGNYDRGHMCPAATRFHPNTKENCRQLSVPTNMSPQLSGLNQNKWATIEGQVRSWGKGCDTLYVVTGAVFKTVGGNESVGYTDKNGKAVAIPNYYYKALLQRRGTGANSTYQALALWVPHKAASGSATLNDVITIDQLEERTGMDFFHNLDSATQESVESSFDNRFWGLQ